ncbi:MAG: dual specificity protein phosphatase family protein [Sphingomicrobium sp.]
MDEGPAAWTPDLHWLSDELAVGGCFPAERAGELARSHGIRAVVDLREEACDDERLLRGSGIDFLHLPTPDLEAASPAMIDRGVAFARGHIERAERVLIHCQHGIGRSPLLALCVLVDLGWSPLEALAHAKDRRAVVSPSRSQFDGWTRWLEQRGHAAPDYHSFGCIAYRHITGR